MSRPQFNMVKGRYYRFIRADGGMHGDKHMHWDWQVGGIYLATDESGEEHRKGYVYGRVGPRNDRGEVAQINWGGWVFEEVTPEPVVTRIEWKEVEAAREAYIKAQRHWLETLSAYQVQEHSK